MLQQLMQTDATHPPQAREYDRCDELLPLCETFIFPKARLPIKPYELEL
jgi:hypothetical protein